jgi:Flp pilus assembly protein TadB
MALLVPYAVTSFIVFDVHVTDWPIWGRVVFCVLIAITLMWYAGRLSLNRQINRNYDSFNQVVDRAAKAIDERSVERPDD